MISKQQQKYIQSLHNKKYRTEYGQFLVEGEKGISELLHSDYQIIQIYITEEFAQKLPTHKNLMVAPVTQIESVSTYKSNASGIAVVQQKRFEVPENFQGRILILDGLRDPGNLGTIIRLADWYGIEHLICSEDTVEFYNPKVISSTMGSFTRVKPYYLDIHSFMEKYPHPILGADLEGQNVHKWDFPKNMALVIGSESHGISAETERQLTDKVNIPRIGKAESLNAAMATGIILDNMFREI
ncbi:tRNA/rRNA methyltransferase (SpoU) [Leadbetterella byssophila DSM 17132]|uniref:tRNA/rRNA methyltransferase (SpoU) n=1 Tax=Leadbetterella byssophila (strain DSM 17132 / JCM 16389 / KACC 11308 / NBRC 106382 / 4M15) TaxID=649349 RepID=E4RY01_LEAB4|nr:RNA methyltransferase [Leadbetterella byssophila]ADQ16329.1 tRNA/rRNA methyltransferase (SpoU) [Leadbetterella byssophila DSM 17132]